MGRAVFPPCYLTWGQTMAEVMKIMAISFKRSHAHTATRNPAAGHSWATPSLETPGHSRASLGQTLVGSLLLYPGSWCTQGSVCALQESIPQSCVSSGNPIVGLMVTCSKETYDIPRSTAPRAPDPAAVHCWPVPPQETLKHSSVSVSVGSLGPGAYKVCLSPLSISGGYGVWFQTWFCPSYHLTEASPLPLDVGFLLKVTPVPCSHHSIAYHFSGASLPLDVGYICLCIHLRPPRWH